MNETSKCSNDPADLQQQQDQQKMQLKDALQPQLVASRQQRANFIFPKIHQRLIGQKRFLICLVRIKESGFTLQRQMKAILK